MNLVYAGVCGFIVFLIGFYAYEGIQDRREEKINNKKES